MSEMLTLAASKREIVGKKVKQLRRQGMIPAVLYGPGAEPLNLTVDQRELRRVLAIAGGTQFIELNVNGERIPSLARAVQRDYLRDEILHVDFYRVVMDRPVTVEVPLAFVGEAPLAESGAAVLMTLATALEIEALPANLPPHIDVDLSRLQEIGDQIQVRDLTLPQGVKVLADPDEVIVKLEPPELLAEEELPAVSVSAEDVEVITKRRAEEEEE